MTQLRTDPEICVEEPLIVGRSIQIGGDLVGQVDLGVEGTIVGSVIFKGRCVVVGANGRVEGGIHARAVMVFGHVRGDIVATEHVEIAPSGTVEGDILAPAVHVAPASGFEGTIEVEQFPEERELDEALQSILVFEPARPAEAVPPTASLR